MRSFHDARKMGNLRSRCFGLALAAVAAACLAGCGSEGSPSTADSGGSAGSAPRRAALPA